MKFELQRFADESTTPTNIAASIEVEDSLSDSGKELLAALLDAFSDTIAILSKEAVEEFIAKLKEYWNNEINNTSSAWVKARNKLYISLVDGAYSVLMNVGVAAVSAVLEKLIKKIVGKL